LSTNIFCLSTRNRKRKNCKRLGCVQPKSSSAWHTGLSGAPDWFPVNRPLSGKVWRRTTIIHWTVRWCTGLSGEPTVVCANDRPCNPRATRGSSNGRWRAPDYPVRHLAWSCNDRLCQKRKEIGTGQATVVVRWCTGLSGAPPDRRQVWPSLIGPQRLLAALGL
jgi:hypothetical protein